MQSGECLQAAGRIKNRRRIRAANFIGEILRGLGGERMAERLEISVAAEAIAECVNGESHRPIRRRSIPPIFFAVALSR